MIDVLSAALLLLGAMSCVVGALGLVRFPDLLSRLQAATKPQTLGLLLLLAGVALQLPAKYAVGLVLVALFQVITAPVLSQLFGRAAYATGADERDALETDDLGERLADRPGAS